MKAPSIRGHRAVAAVVAAASVIALGLAGCSSSGGASNDATGGCPDGKVTLKVLRPTTDIPLDDQLAAYKKTNGCVDFDVTEVPFGQLAQKISVVASSNNGPDIYTVDQPNVQQYAAQGVIAPIDSYLPSGWKQDIEASELPGLSYNGKVYAPGLRDDALALFFNKTYTDKAGITVPTTLDKAWTWDEAKDAMAKCMAANAGTASGADKVYGLAPTFLGDGTPGFSYEAQLFLRSEGDPNAPKSSTAYKTYWGLSKDGKTAEGWLNTPEAVKGAEFYASLFQGSNPVSPKTGDPNSFANGKACFDISTTSNIFTIQSTKPEVDFGVSPLPYFKTPIVHTGSLTMAVASRSKHLADAAKAVVAMSTGKLALQYNNDRTRPSVLKSLLAQQPAFKKEPFQVFAEEIKQWGQPRPPTPHYVQYDQYLTAALRDAAYGQDAKSALDHAASQIQPLLK